MTRGNGAPAQGTQNGTLGTFGGVFTPSILTILGLILFLRVAYVVGSVGLIRGLVILALATSVSVLTSISLAVVATNMQVRGGGEYFLISRTLGIEFGGAVGVVLYLAISVSIAFYAIGFAEALVAALGHDNQLAIRLVAAALVVVLAAVGFVGADLATRLQYLVMVLLVVAIVSFFSGAADEFRAERLADSWGRPESGVGFWEAFAIFFPAVTGFSQGVAMSGDLRTPSRSITRGTFAAVGLSTIVYLAVMVVLAGAVPLDLLVTDTSTVMGDLSLAGWTITVGVLAATVSSALASTLGGPRVLQRLGEDRVLPGLDRFAAGAGPANNPRRALGVSLVIALVTVAAGDINTIAPLISMFFLASYGMINYATYYEMRAGSTSFRPRFRWGDQRASLAGTVACGGAIVAINPTAGVLAGVVLLLLYAYLGQRDVPDRWVDSHGSYHYTRARQHLLALAEEPVTARDWRPCILAFVPRDPSSRQRMMKIASWLEGGSGFLTAVRIMEGSGPVWRRQAREVEEDLGQELDEVVPGAFARVITVENTASGVQALVQTHGIGDVRANLALFGVRDLRGSEEDRLAYGSMLQHCGRFGANVAVVNVRDDAWERFEQTPPDARSIALWWSDDQVGQLITLLGWLCQRSPDWADATVVVHVPHSDDPGEVDRVAALLDAARIRAEVRPVAESPAAFTTALGAATLALAPLRVRRGAAIGPFETPLGMLVESLPLAVMIFATEEVDLDAQPDADLAEFAAATDQAEQARRWAAELDAAAARLLVEAEALRLELENGVSPEAQADGRARLDELEAEAAAAYRTYVDARARCRALEARAAELDPGRKVAELDPDIWQRSRQPAED